MGVRIEDDLLREDDEFGALRCGVADVLACFCVVVFDLEILYYIIVGLRLLGAGVA